MEKILSGKIILITGGTGRLGSEFVRRALQAGGSVFFTYAQNKSEAEALEKEGAEGFCVDLSRTSEIDWFSKKFKEKTKVLDVLIHNAACIRDRTIQNMTEEDWDYVLAVDLKAPYYLTKKMLSPLFKRQPSKVFMMTSRLGVAGGFGVSNYAAAKAGLIALAKSLALELGKKQVLVNAVNPGFMKSAITSHIPEEVLEKQLELSPLHRFSDPAEVAGFLVYLSSDRMSQVTGQVFHFESRKL